MLHGVHPNFGGVYDVVSCCSSEQVFSISRPMRDLKSIKNKEKGLNEIVPDEGISLK